MRYLSFTALLTAALWIPYTICQVRTNGLLTPQNFVPFAAPALVIHVAGKENGMTAFRAISFFWLRLAHAAVMMAALPFIRTIVFTLGFVAVCGLFYEAIR